MGCADWDTRHHIKHKEEKPKPKKHKDEEEDWVGSVSKRRGAIISTHHEDDVVIDESCEWMQKLAKLAANPGQPELDLKMCFIGEKGAKLLAAAIEKAGRMRQMSVMQLYGNYMTSLGISIIANSLERYCSLQRLLLGWNGIDDEGASRLSTTITKINAMVELNLAHNRITNKGAKALAGALMKQPALETLDIQNNSIGIGGLLRLQQVRYQGLTIKSEHNATGAEGFKFKKAGVPRKSLKELGDDSPRESKLDIKPDSPSRKSNKRRSSTSSNASHTSAASSASSPSRSSATTPTLLSPLANKKKPSADFDASPTSPTFALDPTVQLDATPEPDIGDWRARGLPRSPGFAAAAKVGVCAAWESDASHSPSRPRTPLRSISQGGKRPLDRSASTITGPIGFAEPCGKGMTGETWPAAMNLSQLLSEAKVMGEGGPPSLWRPASQGGIRQEKKGKKGASRRT